MNSPLGSRARRLARWRYAALLAALLLLVIAVPVAAERGPLVEWLPDLLFVVVLLASLGTALRRKTVLAGMLVLVTVNQAAKHLGAGLGVSADAAFVVELSASILFFAITVGVILGDVLRDGEVTIDRLLGAAAVYLLIAATFALAFALAHRLRPDALAMPPAVASTLSNRHAALGVYWYFSMTTLTTVGYGDIVPTSALSRGIAMLEATLGQLYLAIVVARLVSLQLVARPSPPAGPPAA